MMGMFSKTGLCAALIFGTLAGLPNEVFNIDKKALREVCLSIYAEASKGITHLPTKSITQRAKRPNMRKVRK